MPLMKIQLLQKKSENALENLLQVRRKVKRCTKRQQIKK